MDATGQITPKMVVHRIRESPQNAQNNSGFGITSSDEILK